MKPEFHTPSCIYESKVIPISEYAALNAEIENLKTFIEDLQDRTQRITNFKQLIINILRTS